MSLRLNEKGVTLTELMVAVGLFGVMSMALMSIMATHSKNAAKSLNETGLSEQIIEFSTAVESYLSNTTRINSCGCGSGCVFDTTTPDCINGAQCTNATIIDFEAESATEVGTASLGTCLTRGARPEGTLGETLTPRGCKRRYVLSYAPPTQINTSGTPARVGTAGRLEFRDAVSGELLHFVSGVYSFRCGHLPTNPGAGTLVPSADHFQLEIRAKARMFNDNASTDASLLEGWHPSDNLFGSGTHRELSTQVLMRNFTTQGVHFARAFTFANCARDGSLITAGNCCSGYSAGGVCLPMTSCITAGSAGTDTSCCSHMIDGSGNCL